VQPHSSIDANLVAFWAVLAKRVESEESPHRLNAPVLDGLDADTADTGAPLLVATSTQALHITSLRARLS
jgi:hypothetical protein